MFQGMLDAALTSSEVQQQVWPHDPPSQSRSPGNHGVHVRHVHNTLSDQVDDLSLERGLQPIGNVPDNLPAQMDGSFADRSVERHRLPDRLWRRYGTSDDLDQRDKVRRIE